VKKHRLRAKQTHRGEKHEKRLDSDPDCLISSAKRYPSAYSFKNPCSGIGWQGDFSSSGVDGQYP
jgi:hypothetical protein